MCFYPRCLWMSTDASLGAGLHSHSHALSLSVSPCVCLHFVSYKNSCAANVYHHWNTRFVCIRLFSFHKGSTNTKQLLASNYITVVEHLATYCEIKVSNPACFCLAPEEHVSEALVFHFYLKFVSQTELASLPTWLVIWHWLTCVWKSEDWFTHQTKAGRWCIPMQSQI